MGEYDSPRRILPYPLKNALVISRTVEEDGLHGPSSFVWPEDPDERVELLFTLSLNEYVVLASTIDVGSDIAYGEDAPRVWWLWTRTLQEGMSMACCEDILAAIESMQGDIYGLYDKLAEQSQLRFKAEIDLQEALSQQRRIYLISIYDGDPCSIDSNLACATHNWVDAHYDEAVLCSAMTAFVYGWAALKAEEALSQHNFEVAVYTALALTGILIFSPAATGLFAYYGFWGLGGSSLGAYDALTNQTALNRFICKMVADMAPEEINAGTFTLAPSHFTFAPGSPERIIQSMIAPTLGDNYLTFLGYFGIAYQRFESDLTPPVACPCVDENCFQLVIDNGTTAPFAALGILVSQTTTYMIYQAQEFFYGGGSAYGVQIGDSNQTAGCLYSGYTITDGTFTANGTPSGFIAYMYPTGTETDIDATGYDVSFFSFNSSTPFTIKLMLS